MAVIERAVDNAIDEMVSIEKSAGNAIDEMADDFAIKEFLIANRAELKENIQ